MRKPRILREGAIYHVSGRASRHEMIFEPGKIKELFLDTLKRAKSRYRFRVENFCIMGNHYHLIIKPAKGESLSRIMQWIMSVFAKRFNALFGYWGPVWGARFFSCVLANFTAFLKAFIYVDQNPVAAGMVSCAEEWPFCGRRHARDGCDDILAPLDPRLHSLFPAYVMR